MVWTDKFFGTNNIKKLLIKIPEDVYTKLGRVMVMLPYLLR